MKEEILKLRTEGKSYNEICSILNCSKGTVAYHCGTGQKEKNNLRSRLSKQNNPLKEKLDKFKERVRDFQRNRGSNGVFTFGRQFNITVEDVLNKLGDNPICYLTGRKIDFSRTNSYHFDHIHPVSKGGSCELDNLGLSCKDANLAKKDLSLEEFIALCIDVLEHQGYDVSYHGR